MSNKISPFPFHILVKPTGAMCNLSCDYCYFLKKKILYPKSNFRMKDELLEDYISQYIRSQPFPEINIAWQGGEPTLMGLDFYLKSIKYVQKYKPPNIKVNYLMQTNGTLLDKKWCKFFHRHNFLIGLSLDGPQKLHNAYRVDKRGNPTYNKVIHGLDLLKRFKVQFNILTTVHAANAKYPLEVYRFLRDEIGAKFIQFIPIVERDNTTGFQEGNAVTERSVKAEQYGIFLNKIFNEWVRRDVGRIFVQIFDVLLGVWAGAPSSLCVFSPTCGNALAMEHNGDLYSCDHFVEPKYLLGNIKEKPIIELVNLEKQRQFGLNKKDNLTNYCKECKYLFACRGGCPKNRFINAPDGEIGLNYLCAGYKLFFNNINESMELMTSFLRNNQPAAEIMKVLKDKE